MEPTQLEINNPHIDLGEEFLKAKMGLLDFEKATNNLKAIDNDPDNFIYNYFAELKTKIELERENTKDKIDDHFDLLIKEIHELENQCKQMKIVQQHEEVIEKFQSDLNRLNEEINIPKVNEAKWARIKFEASEKISETNLIIENYQNELLRNQSFSIKTIQGEVEKLLEAENIIQIFKIPSNLTIILIS